MAQKVSSLIVLIAIISSQLVSAHYIPYLMYQNEDQSVMPTRRQDLDDDDGEEMDSNASAPYQNQEGNGANGDGYDDSETDGPYEETPREQEGQADLERFFDDHLGASDRDGMDKENLPTNVLPIVVMPTKEQLNSPLETVPTPPLNANEQQQQQPHTLPTIQTEFIRLPDEKLIITRQVTQDTSRLGNHYYPTENSSNNNIKQPPHRIPAPVKLNDNVWTEGNLNRSNYSDRSNDYRPRSSIEFNNEQPESGRAKVLDDKSVARNGLDPVGSEVVVSEDDDFKRVYVTKATNKPFRIEALGGFDPEKDFIDASREMDGLMKADSPSANRQRRHNTDNIGRSIDLYDDQDDDDVKQPPAVTSPDQDTHTLWEDASNTDEITFGQDDPYQTDLEAEMRHQAFDKIGIFNANRNNNNLDKPETDTKLISSANQDDGIDDDDDGDDGEQQRQTSELAARRESVKIDKQQQQLDRRNDDNNDNSMGSGRHPESKKEDVDDEGDWAHDGVEDMDIPSQARQNQVLEKAAKQEAVARRKAEEDEAVTREAENETPSVDEPDDQRMPNADYMKNVFREPDESL